jgi:hypothetical protein
MLTLAYTPRMYESTTAQPIAIFYGIHRYLTDFTNRTEFLQGRGVSYLQKVIVEGFPLENLMSITTLASANAMPYRLT